MTRSAYVLLRFDYASVFSISLLFGFVALTAGIGEIALVFVSNNWGRLSNALLAIVFVAAAVPRLRAPARRRPRRRRAASAGGQQVRRRRYADDT